MPQRDDHEGRIVEMDETSHIALLYHPEANLVEYTTERAQEWLTDERRSRLEDLVDSTRECDGKVCSFTSTDYELRIVRMQGALGTRVLLSLRPLSYLGSDELAEALTDRQLEVAKRAAIGETAAEIGDEFGISEETVYDHIRNIYDRLGIGSRAELANKMARGSETD